MGGVAGHMAHLSEDLDLTFNEIVQILTKVADADIKNATEKVDGQNLFMTVDESGEIRTARNNSDIESGGMTTDEYISKWKGHPAETAFTNGFKAISAALRKLSPEALSDIFSDGRRYVNMEIMYPKNPNIILYTSPQIVLHGLQSLGEEDTEELQHLAKKKFPHLVAAVDGGQEEVGEEIWGINGPKIVALQKLADGSAIEEVTAKIQSFAAPVGMDAQLKDYVELVVRKYAEQVDLPSDVTDKLVLLMVDSEAAADQGITATNLKKGLPKELKPVISKLGTKTNSRKYIASILQPIEVAISDFAIEVLRGLKSFFVDEHDEEVMRMRADLEQSIVYLKSLQDSGDEKMGELIDKQLAKLGDIENLASSMEGVVFEYPPGSDRIYKLTGAFAMSNQIIGRARRSGMTESPSQDFTIRISKDREVTKSIDEWLEEIKTANHTYTKLPQSVYEDILGGTAIVDIVEQENALPTIYNAVMGYVNGLLEEDEGDEVDIELIDDETADPVVDADFSGPMTYAIVPGAFKPPHKGHADMVYKYATGEGGAPKADEVRVVISAPMGAQRTLRDGMVIDEKHAIALWKNLFPEVANLPNVKFEIAPSHMRSPITVAYEYIGDKSPIPYNEGDKVILGASRKDDDWKRWRDAEKYVQPGIELLSGEEYAVPALMRQGGTDFSATAMRDLISDLVEDPTNGQALEELKEFVPADKIADLFNVLGLSEPTAPIDEISTMSGGAVQGAPAAGGGPWVKKDFSKENEKEKKRSKLTKRENVDLSIIDNVIRLIMEKGIMR
jgi:hypothetical protein